MTTIKLEKTGFDKYPNYLRPVLQTSFQAGSACLSVLAFYHTNRKLPALFMRPETISSRIGTIKKDSVKNYQNQLKKAGLIVSSVDPVSGKKGYRINEPLIQKILNKIKKDHQLQYVKGNRKYYYQEKIEVHEKKILFNILESKNIKLRAAHLDLYSFLTAFNYSIFDLSSRELANKTCTMSANTVLTTLRDFEKCGIIKRDPGSQKRFRFLRLNQVHNISIEKELPEKNKQPGLFDKIKAACFSVFNIKNNEKKKAVNCANLTRKNANLTRKSAQILPPINTTINSINVIGEKQADLINRFSQLPGTKILNYKECFNYFIQEGLTEHQYRKHLLPAAKETGSTLQYLSYKIHQYKHLKHKQGKSPGMLFNLIVKNKEYSLYHTFLYKNTELKEVKTNQVQIKENPVQPVNIKSLDKDSQRSLSDLRNWSKAG